jgi:hypothetical protein
VDGKGSVAAVVHQPQQPTHGKQSTQDHAIHPSYKGSLQLKPTKAKPMLAPFRFLDTFVKKLC